MRILHVVLWLEAAGLEHMVLDFTRLGVEAGHQIDVVCIERRGELARAVEDAGGRVHCLNKPPGFCFKELDGMRDILRGIRPDIVHTHYPGGLYYAGPPARRIGLDMIVHTVHGANYERGWRRRLIGRLGARHARYLVCVSKDTAAHVLQHRIVRKNKIRVIYNGIDVLHFEKAQSERQRMRSELDIPRSANVIGTVGRLCDVKRQDVLIKAFARVRQSVTDCHLLLVGDGPNRQQLMRLSSSLRVDPYVHFAGYRADRERCLAAMDLFSLTSDSEGTPLSLLEAWAVGLPAVVTAVGGLPELVEDNTTGVLVPPRDPECIAMAMIRIFQDRKLQHTLVEASKRVVRNRFDRREMFRQYSDLYASMLDRVPSRFKARKQRTCQGRSG